MNKLKTTKTIILTAFVVVGSLFNSCSKDDDDKNVSIVGTWIMKSSVEETFVNNVSTSRIAHSYDENNYDNYELKADNTFINKYTKLEGGALVQYTDNGTYTVMDNKLTLIYEGFESDVDIYEYKLEGNVLVVESTDYDTETNTKYVETANFNRQ